MRKRVSLPLDVAAQMSGFFGSWIAQVRIYEEGLPSLGSTRTVGSRLRQGVYFQAGAIAQGVDASGHWQHSLRYTLAHELVHAWQARTGGARYMGCSLREQLQAVSATGDRGAAYEYRLLPEQPLSSYGTEQQASILGDYFARSVLHWEAPTRQLCLDYEAVGREGADSICSRRRQEMA